MANEKIKAFFEGNPVLSPPRKNDNNFIILNVVDKTISEMSFDELLRFQKNTLLEDSDYMVIRGNILKTFGEPGIKLLSNFGTYKKEAGNDR